MQLVDILIALTAKQHGAMNEELLSSASQSSVLIAVIMNSVKGNNLFVGIMVAD